MSMQENACSTMPLSPHQEVMNDLENRIHQLGDEIRNLTQRLDPVKNKEPRPEAVQEKFNPSSVPVLAHAQTLENVVAQLREQVRDVIDRLVI